MTVCIKVDEIGTKNIKKELETQKRILRGDTSPVSIEEVGEFCKKAIYEKRLREGDPGVSDEERGEFGKEAIYESYIALLGRNIEFLEGERK